MRTFACKKCGSLDVYVKENGTQTGLYCGNCGAWLKWLGKEEKRFYFMRRIRWIKRIYLLHVILSTMKDGWQRILIKRLIKMIG
mgnify:CR=1 FL=1